MATTRSRALLAVLGSLFVAVILMAAFASKNPLRKSETGVRSWLLSRATLGSSVHDVEQLISSEGWKQNYHWQGRSSELSLKFYPGVQGNEIVGAYLGHYQGLPWRVDVDAFWGFDSNGKLIDLKVRKIADAL